MLLCFDRYAVMMMGRKKFQWTWHFHPTCHRNLQDDSCSINPIDKTCFLQSYPARQYFRVQVPGPKSEHTFTVDKSMECENMHFFPLHTFSARRCLHGSNDAFIRHMTFSARAAGAKHETEGSRMPRDTAERSSSSSSAHRCTPCEQRHDTQREQEPPQL